MNQTLNTRCYTLLGQIPKGKVTTYKELAHALGTHAYRAVGTALSKNPDLISTPCHRVIRSDGSVGGYALGTEKKIELLKSEGLEIIDGKVKNLQQYIHTFNPA